MFPVSEITSPFAALMWGRAVQRWREAAGVVWARWEAFLAAEPEFRAWAFVSYTAALDVEEAAAGEVAALSTRIAA